MGKQQKIDGSEVQYPECEFEECDTESTRVFVLRGMSADKTHRCENEDHEPYWKGPGGIEEVRPVEPSKDTIQTEAGGE